MRRTLPTGLRPRSRALAAVAAAIVAAAPLAGCGKKEEQKVRTTVEAFYAAVTAREGQKACQRLTPAAQRRLEQGGKQCPAAVIEQADLGSRAGVGNIVIRGKSASANANAATQKRTLRLSKFGEAWRIDSGF